MWNILEGICTDERQKTKISSNWSMYIAEDGFSCVPLGSGAQQSSALPLVTFVPDVKAQIILDTGENDYGTSRHSHEMNSNPTQARDFKFITTIVIEEAPTPGWNWFECLLKDKVHKCEHSREDTPLPHTESISSDKQAKRIREKQIRKPKDRGRNEFTLMERPQFNLVGNLESAKRIYTLVRPLSLADNCLHCVLTWPFFV